MKQIDDLQCGKAGEYLVCADLILMGHVAFPSEQGLPFDVVAEVNGRLLRIQVKTTREPRTVPQRKEHIPGYLFHARRMGKGGRKRYTDEVDIFAFVALDAREIGYVAADDVAQSMIFRVTAFKGQYHNEKHEERNKAIREMRLSGMTYPDIAKQLGVDKAFAHRVCTRVPTSKGLKDGKYLSQYAFDDAVVKVVGNA
jgi:hypothetical protein